MRKLLGGCVLAGLLTSTPAAASASVLVNAPAPFVKRCGARIEVGVWRRDDGRPDPRTVLITIRARSGRLIWHRRARPTDTWRFWRYRPKCGRRYVVRYKSRLWSQAFPVRIRASR